VDGDGGKGKEDCLLSQSRGCVRVKIETALRPGNLDSVFLQAGFFWSAGTFRRGLAVGMGWERRSMLIDWALYFRVALLYCWGEALDSTCSGSGYFIE
jgi:hypothetical protein